MNVKELKERLESMEDDDQVFVEFPDMGTGGYDTTDEVAVEVTDSTHCKKGKVTITAAVL